MKALIPHATALGNFTYHDPTALRFMTRTTKLVDSTLGTRVWTTSASNPVAGFYAFATHTGSASSTTLSSVLSSSCGVVVGPASATTGATPRGILASSFFRRFFLRTPAPRVSRASWGFGEPSSSSWRGLPTGVVTARLLTAPLGRFCVAAPLFRRHDDAQHNAPVFGVSSPPSPPPPSDARRA